MVEGALQGLWSWLEKLNGCYLRFKKSVWMWAQLKTCLLSLPCPLPATLQTVDLFREWLSATGHMSPWGQRSSRRIRYPLVLGFCQTEERSLCRFHWQSRVWRFTRSTKTGKGLGGANWGSWTRMALKLKVSLMRWETEAHWNQPCQEADVQGFARNAVSMEPRVL